MEKVFFGKDSYGHRYRWMTGNAVDRGGGGGGGGRAWA